MRGRARIFTMMLMVALGLVAAGPAEAREGWRGCGALILDSGQVRTLPNLTFLTEYKAGGVYRDASAFFIQVRNGSCASALTLTGAVLAATNERQALSAQGFRLSSVRNFPKRAIPAARGRTYRVVASRGRQDVRYYRFGRSGMKAEEPENLVIRGEFACRRGRAGESVRVAYRLTHRVLNYTGNWVNGAPEIHEQLRQEFALGNVSVRASTCLTRHGWRILAGGAIESDATGLNREGIPRGNAHRERGWGVLVLSGDGSRLEVVVPRCKRRGSWRGTFKTLVGLPLPGPWKLSAALWYAGVITPEDEPRANCIEVTRLSIRLRVTQRGHLIATAEDAGPWSVTAEGSPVFDTYEVNSTVSQGN